MRWTEGKAIKDYKMYTAYYMTFIRYLYEIPHESRVIRKKTYRLIYMLP